MNDSSITSLPTAPDDDRHARMVRYAVLMGIRMVCFGLAIFVPGWWKLLPIALAVFLPYFAVVIANVGNTGAGTVESPGGVLPYVEPIVPVAESVTPDVAEETNAPTDAWYDPREDLDPFPVREDDTEERRES